ncbi:unnamed protein product [Rodentolepis nana]|uniref:Serine/arginine repetitive matrix protein 1-like n=1 Tax=Rodentolepis nana TaxID=102285 RepID=A0A0R3TTZ4_RODNA|nr:unnamed protein product [Rodentolepis nana]
MITSRNPPKKDIDQDEGELDSEDDTKLSSSEGYTSDGGSDSGSNIRSDNTSVDETPWERGLRLAREHARKSKLLRESEPDLEDKKFNLAVVAPDLAEDGALADICDMGRSNPSDTFWINYHKLSIIGATQITCKRALPCDLDPPSQKTIVRWRRSVKKCRHRSSSASSPSSTPSSPKSLPSSSVSSNFASRSSSLSSLAGSIYQAVPHLLLAGDSGAENSRRRRRKRSGSSTSTRSSSRTKSRSSSPKPVVTQKASKGARGSYSASSRSRSSSQSPRNRSGVEKRPSFTRSRRGSGIGSFGNQQQRQPPISGYHHQQTSFSRGASFRDGDDGQIYGERRGYGDLGRWREPSDRSPERPPMPSEHPVKRSWPADPPRQRGPDRQRSPLLKRAPPQHQVSRRSRSGSKEEPEDRSTYANTSWSQTRGRKPAPKAPPLVSTQVDRSSVRSSLDSPPRKRQLSVPSHSSLAHLTCDFLIYLVDLFLLSAEFVLNAVTAPGPSSRRKSRSPFADSYFGNPPPPSAQPAAVGDGDLASSIPFEQTVPLLAGAVNPAAPTNPSRPGVKLTIAPRIRVGGNALMERPAPTVPSNSYPRMTEGSPVSSTSSSPQMADRRRDNSMRRQGGSGYIAVSPGGFDSPPPPKLQQQQRPVSRARGFDQSEDQSRMRGRGSAGHGEYGRDRDDRHGRADFKNDRFSRGGGQSDRYRDRRPPPPSSNDRFDRRGGGAMNDRNPTKTFYDRGRDYGGDSHYGRSRGGRVDCDRGYDRGRNGIDRRRQDIDRRGGDRDRSRSPFEDRRRRDRDASTSLSNKEARLDELRKRLAVLDDKITELGGGNR